jgi:rare lipoprotein A
MKFWRLANRWFVGWLGLLAFAVSALVGPLTAISVTAADRSLQENTSSSKTAGGKRGASGRGAGKPEPERGYAAFYSSSLEGHKTACGGVYSASKLTAAHRNLPCGTRLRVTNLRNGKTVRVTVTDHGPFSNGRILDLSYAAAVHLAFVKQGTTLVKVEVLR